MKQTITSFKQFNTTIRKVDRSITLYYGFSMPVNMKTTNRQEAYKKYKTYYNIYDRNIPGNSYLRNKNHLKYFTYLCNTNSQLR